MEETGDREDTCVNDGSTGRVGRTRRLGPSNPWARKTELLLERFPRNDGERWTGAEIERETTRRGRKVSGSYFSALSNGCIWSPGAEHLGAIAEAMGFWAEFWHRDPEEWDRIPCGRPPSPEDIGGLDDKDRVLVETMRRLAEEDKAVVLVLATRLAAIPDGGA